MHGVAGPASGPSDTRAELLARTTLTERRLNLAGVDTAILEGGRGAPVVVLHGVGQFGAIWSRLMPALTAAHHVVVPDLPGQGDSAVTADVPLDADQVLAWLGALIDQTCSAPPVLIGQQAGGAIAARFAADHEDRIRGLVLVDSLGLARFRPAPRFALAMVGFLAHPTEHTRDRFLGQCMLDIDDVHQQMGRHWELMADYALEGARTPSTKAAGRRLMKAFGVSAIPEERLARITVPTTLIWGRHDSETRLKVGEAASARYGWPLLVIDDCGADPNLEQPEALEEALQEALTAC